MHEGKINKAIQCFEKACSPYKDTQDIHQSTDENIKGVYIIGYEYDNLLLL